MKVLKLPVDAPQYSQIMENAKTELLLPITEENQDQYVLITPNEVTIVLYDQIEVSHNGKKAIVTIDHIELDYSPDEEGFIQLYENKKHKLCIADANIAYQIGERKEL